MYRIPVSVWVWWSDDDDRLSQEDTQRAAGNPCGFFFVQDVRYAAGAWMCKSGDARILFFEGIPE